MISIICWPRSSAIWSYCSSAWQATNGRCSSPVQHSRRPCAAPSLAAQLLAFSRTQKLALGVIDLNAALRGTDESLAAGPSRPSRGCQCQTARAGNFEPGDQCTRRDAGRRAAHNCDWTAGEYAGSKCDGGDELGPGRYVVISVADTGSGMPPEVLARAMEPFFTTKGIEQGTGLGLSQVYGIARQSGGDVRIESSAGRGTTVRILLREAGRAARPDGNTAIDPSSLSQLDQGPLGSVLVVDDDEDVRGIFVAGLEAYGYRVYEAADGPAALHMLEQGMTIVAVVD